MATRSALTSPSTSMLTLSPSLRKAGSMRESHDPAALAKRRSRLLELRAASTSSSGSSSQASEAAIAFGIGGGKRGSKRDRRRGGAGAASGSTASTMRKSQSLDAAESYSLSSIQSPLWVTLTNARTIEELAQQKL
ncbi:GH12014 [Drosophila grimshawi]|uniref:GH12014 n=3 Tax=Drosophila grimshawi TaxID=7222 RepID=B4JKR3_DROGR|nr:GH12014 [Drosophila grimshawi]